MTPMSHGNDPLLDKAIRALKRVEAEVLPSERLERAVMEGWDLYQVKAQGIGRGVGIGIGIAASIALITGVVLLQQRSQSSVRDEASHVPVSVEKRPLALSNEPVVPSPRAGIEREPSVERSADLPLAAPTSRESATLVVVGEPLVAGEAIRVVRMRVPGSTLTALGIRSVGSPEPASVDLDVLVGEDGVARAVRVGM